MEKSEPKLLKVGQVYGVLWDLKQLTGLTCDQAHKAIADIRGQRFDPNEWRGHYLEDLPTE